MIRYIRRPFIRKIYRIKILLLFLPKKTRSRSDHLVIIALVAKNNARKYVVQRSVFFTYIVFIVFLSIIEIKYLKNTKINTKFFSLKKHDKIGKNHENH